MLRHLPPSPTLCEGSHSAVLTSSICCRHTFIDASPYTAFVDFHRHQSSMNRPLASLCSHPRIVAYPTCSPNLATRRPRIVSSCHLVCPVSPNPCGVPMFVAIPLFLSLSLGFSAPLIVVLITVIQYTLYTLTHTRPAESAPSHSQVVKYSPVSPPPACTIDRLVLNATHVRSSDILTVYMEGTGRSMKGEWGVK